MSDSQHVVCPHCNSTNRVPADKNIMQAKCGHCHEVLFDDKPINLDDSAFVKHVNNSDIPIVADFWADWCAPCQIMTPVLQQAASQMSPNVRFVKVDTDEYQRLAGQYNIRGLPTLVIFKNGKEVDRKAGAMDVGSLVDWVSRTI